VALACPRGRSGLDALVGWLAYWNWRGMDAVEDVLRGGAPIGLHDRPPARRLSGRIGRRLLKPDALPAER
jgi:hypothetical protein